MIELSDLADAFLLVLLVLVVALYHVDKLVNVAARHDDITNFLFGLHSPLYHKRAKLLLCDHCLTDGFPGVLLDLFSESVCVFKQMVVNFI